MHDCLRHLIGDSLAHDVEVRANEAADEFGFEGFALGEGGLVGAIGLSAGGLARDDRVYCTHGSFLLEVYRNLQKASYNRNLGWSDVNHNHLVGNAVVVASALASCSRRDGCFG